MRHPGKGASLAVTGPIIGPRVPVGCMANTTLLVVLVLLILLVGGPLLLVGTLAAALRIFLWVALILLVLGLVGALLSGPRSGPRYH